MPAWDLVNFSNFEMDLHHYNNPKNFNFKTIVPVVSERGCPFRCNFCDLYLIQGRKLRRKSANKFVDELEVLNKEYGQNYFSFMDDNLTVDRKHIISICKEIIRRRLNIQFGTVGGLHVNSLDDEIIELMVEAGMVDALIAPEHGSDYMRNVVIKKMLEREKIYEVVEIIQKYKVNLGGNWIMGFPEETNDTLTDMYNMIEDLKLDRNSVGTAIPFPGTELFDQCIRDDLFVDNIDVNSLWSTPIWAFKTFDNDAPPKSEFLIKPYDMELEELATWREKFNDVRYKYFGYFHDEFKQPKRFWATDANQLQGNQPSTAI